MKTKLFIPFAFLLCIIINSCSSDFCSDNRSDAILTEEEALSKIYEIANDYGVNVKITNISKNMVWTSQRIETLENLIKGFSRLKGRYKLISQRDKNGKIHFKQALSTSRTKRLGRVNESPSEEDISYSWAPDESTNYFFGDFVFDCYFSALWTVDKNGHANWGEVGGGINRVEGSGGVDVENSIMEEGLRSEYENWKPAGDGEISFDGDFCYFITIDMNYTDAPYGPFLEPLPVTTELKISYSGSCSGEIDSTNTAVTHGSISWFEKNY